MPKSLLSVFRISALCFCFMLAACGGGGGAGDTGGTQTQPATWDNTSWNNMSWQ